MDYLAGQAYLSSGRPAEAHARYKHAVENYPLSDYSYLGLVGLLDAGVAVDDLDRGLTDYFAGVYDKALEALDRHIASNPEGDGTAHYYRAASLDQLQQYPEALEAYTYFIQRYASHPKWATPGLKTTIRWFNGHYPGNTQTLLDYMRAAPGPQLRQALLTARGWAGWALRQRDLEPHRSGTRCGAPRLCYAGIMQYRQADFRRTVL
jgi:tetratricopeptide (TPR) repeat protein